MFPPLRRCCLARGSCTGAFSADKGVLPSISPTHAAYCCVFINVRNTLSYTSILPASSNTALLKPSLFTLKLLPFHPQFLNFCPLTSFHFTLKFCSLRPQTFSISCSNFRSFILTPHPFALVVLLFSSFCNRPTPPPCNPRNAFQFSLPICRTYIGKAFFPFCRTMP